MAVPRRADGERMWEGVFPGTGDQARNVRSVIRALLGECRVADDVVLISSELAGNAVLHSRSGEPGGVFVVRLGHCGGWVRGAVEDEGSCWDGDLAGSARERSGLFLVRELASACGVTAGHGCHRVVWFCVRCEPGCAGEAGR